MTRGQYGCLVSVSVALLAAGEQPWKDKRISEWSEADARQVLTDSPWAKPVTPKFNRPSGGQRGSRGGMGRIGLGIPGVGIGMGGPRIGGRGGGVGGRGGPWGGTGDGRGRSPEATPPALTVRWESALPVQEAELKSRDANAPSVDEGHYAVAVLGLPTRMVGSDPQDSAGRPKPQAELRRHGKKTIRPSSVRVLSRDDGPLVLFLFPRSREITLADKQVEFRARIGRLELKQTFELGEMKYAGKLEL